MYVLNRFQLFTNLTKIWLKGTFAILEMVVGSLEPPKYLHVPLTEFAYLLQLILLHWNRG